MSIKSEESVEADDTCASCGVAPVDDIKLKICDGGCDLVKYCSDQCQENHSEQHEADCKKRKAELHDKELFEQPEESNVGDCPLCFLPLSLDPSKSRAHSCCCKFVCLGCIYAYEMSNGGDRCPFCREPTVNREEKHCKRAMKRVKVNDPNALRQMGAKHYNEGDYKTALEYLTRAAKLGDAEAHHNLGSMYYRGEGVEKDEEKAIHHYEKAAIGGHPGARHVLALFEEINVNFERAVKHLIIAANLGYEETMKALWEYYSDGHITKEDLDATLRAHQSAIDATKSAQRDAAEAYYR
jgi:tetratricopeptide (TPR) repeat protein